jgi:hypothetical protein
VTDTSDLIFGSYSHAKIAEAVDDPTWQALRACMMGTSTEAKLRTLRSYVASAPEAGTPAGQRVRIQVTNYVNALRRGGLL